MTVAESDVPITMRKVYRRLERWRSQRTGRLRIPTSIWSAAGELAREQGVNAVSRVLRLEFNHLKAHGAGCGRKRRQEAHVQHRRDADIVSYPEHAEP